MQAKRHKNFQYLRQLIRNVARLEPLALRAGVRAHGMHMFAMRYRQEHCGGLSLGNFLAPTRRILGPARPAARDRRRQRAER
jgi:hypothetical protein